MNIKYMAAEGEDRVWEDGDPSVFDNIEGLPYWKKGIYFHPTDSEDPVWLWMVGQEKAMPDKMQEGRVWRSRWVLHFCVKGKGYYNGQLITKGMAFICWPHLVHTLAADPDDPFEFYWLMLRGKDVLPLVREFGFRSTELIFDCGYIDQVVPLLKHCINADYSKVYIPDYTNALIRMVLSFQKCALKKELGAGSPSECYANYVESAKHILHDYNYAISVQKLSSMLGITPKHFSRVFGKVCGESPKQYITRRRLELGAEMLQSGIPASEVAMLLKYTDYTSFYRAFLAQYHIHPSLYLKKGK